MSKDFDRLYPAAGRESIAPERLLRALLVQVFYSIRSERMLVEQINYSWLFSWFVGLDLDDVESCGVQQEPGTSAEPGDRAYLLWARTEAGPGVCIERALQPWMGR